MSTLNLCTGVREEGLRIAWNKTASYANFRSVSPKKMKKILLAPVLWFSIVVGVTVLAVFWEPLFSGLYFWGPDSSSLGWIEWRNAMPERYLGMWDNLHGLGSGSSARPMILSHLFAFIMPVAGGATTVMPQHPV